MPDVAELLERESARIDLDRDHFERLTRRRDRKVRNRRIAAATLAIILALVSFAALTHAFRIAEGPASEPTPKPPGIFSKVGGWIAYGNDRGIWAVDPTRPVDPKDQIRLSTARGMPLAWSSDGSKLLIQGYESGRLFVLNSDGTETYVTTIHDPVLNGRFFSGGSFSPDGSQVIFAARGREDGRSSIYVVDSHGGTPRVLLTAGRRLFPSTGRKHSAWLSNPTSRPTGPRSRTSTTYSTAAPNFG